MQILSGKFPASPSPGDFEEGQMGGTVLRSKWRWFFAIGVVLSLAGMLSILFPDVSTFATGTVFGVVLAIAGVAKMVMSMSIRQWSGFIWQELTGAAELVGGILIYFNPLKGALAVTLLIALVLLVQGILHLALAFRTRTQPGWPWFAAAGLTAIGGASALAFKIPYTIEYQPGAIAGITLLVAGVAYIAIALTMRMGTQS